MTEDTGKIYEFDDFRLDTAEHALTCRGRSLPLTPKVFDLLVLLIENRGRLMGKNSLIEALWKDSFVEEANLNVNISALRRILGEKPNEHRYIETVPRRGYRFVADVKELEKGPMTQGEFRTSDDGPEKSLAIELSTPEADTSPNQISKKSRSPLKPARLKRIALLSGVLGILLITALFVFLIWNRHDQTKSSEVINVQTLAVLPFRPLSKGQSDEALEIGMADALITKLSGLQQITVRPTSAIEKYAAPDIDPLAAGRDLQVEAVLEGKIQRSDDKIRVTVQLLRVSDGAAIWAGSFDDFFTNIFAVQDSISERMVSALALKMSRHEREMLQKRNTEDAEAYQLYLQGRYYQEKITEEGTKNALVYFRAAVEKDPNYALAYASMTGVFTTLGNLNLDREANTTAARDSATKAVELDPNLAEAHEALATIYATYDWNWQAAETEFQKALELDPKSVDALSSYSVFLSIMKRPEDALRKIEEARQINPTALWVQNQLVQTLIRARRFDDGIAEAKRALEIDPNDRQANTSLIRLYLLKGMPSEAGQQLEKFPGISERSKLLFTSEISLLNHNRQEGEQGFRKLIEKYSASENIVVLAFYNAKIHKIDKTFELLEMAYQQRDGLLVSINLEPEMDTIHNDARYADLVHRIGIPE